VCVISGVPLEPDHCHRDRCRHEAGLGDGALSRLQGVAVPILRERGIAISRKSHHRRPWYGLGCASRGLTSTTGRIPQILDRPPAADCVVRLIRQVWLSDGQGELHRTGLLQCAVNQRSPLHSLRFEHRQGSSGKQQAVSSPFDSSPIPR
jgi:hypothetical protein